MEIHEGRQLQIFAKMHKLGIQGLADELGQTRVNMYHYFGKEILDIHFKEKIANAYKIDVSAIWPQTNEHKNATELYKELPHVTGDELRRQKAFGETEDEGLLYVPVGAQANYARHFIEPVFLEQCKRWKIPDFPYKGDKYRIFEVEGDSMTYTDDKGRLMGLMNGYQVIGEKVEPEDWKYSTQWYVHVLVFETFLTIKRVWRDDASGDFILISDNPGYPQKRYKMSDVKELWVMKRYMGYDMSPPKMYEITV